MLHDARAGRPERWLTLAKKLEVVHSTTVTINRKIPSVRRAMFNPTPAWNPFGFGVAEAADCLS